MGLSYNDQEMSIQERLRSYGSHTVVVFFASREGKLMGRVREARNGDFILKTVGGDIVFTWPKVTIATRAGLVVIDE